MMWGCVTFECNEVLDEVLHELVLCNHVTLEAEHSRNDALHPSGSVLLSSRTGENTVPDSPLSKQSYGRSSFAEGDLTIQLDSEAKRI
jgi:hypothetical protein